MTSRSAPRCLSRVLTFTFLIAMTLLTMSSVSAQSSDPGFGIKAEPGTNPAETANGYFVFQTRSGDTVTGTLRFSNPTDTEITVALTAVDAITANNGGSAFATDEIELAGVGTWLAIDSPEIVLKPGEDQLVAFTATVPKKTIPGQYLAGLAATVADPAAASTPIAGKDGQAGASVIMRTRYVIAVEFDIGSDWSPSLLINSVTLINQPSGPVVGIALQNDGETFLHPSGTIELTDASGAVALTQVIEMGTFVTGTSVVYPVSWQGEINDGTYQAHVMLTYGNDQTVEFNGEILFGKTTASASSIRIADFSIVEVDDPATAKLQVVNVSVTINNPGETVANGQLILHVERDGVLVEDLSLGSALTFPLGTAEITQRYLPLSGWQPGTYTFSVLLQSVDPATGIATTLTTVTASSPLIVG